MAIFDVEADLIDNNKWYAQKYYNANPSTFRNPIVYDMNVSDLDVVPITTEFSSTPQLTNSATQVVRNNTSKDQSQTVLFSEKSIETFSRSTTEGYKIGSSIKSTTSFKVKVGFLVSGEINQSIEVAITGEYNHSSTETTTTTNEKLWQVTQPVIIPPYTQVTATLQIFSGPFVVPAKTKATIQGKGTNNGAYNFASAITYTDNSGRVYTDRNRAQALYTDRNEWPGYKRIYVGGSSSTDPTGLLRLEGEARITAQVGLYAVTEFRESPLPGYAGVGSNRTYYAPNILLGDGSVIQFPEYQRYLQR
uniref:Crystal protein n=1 Tax=Bacillus thuringiensis TaxID=1428 RepID=D4QGQ7_BACTU|nr:crystal protein [Bacillus thuringiensis]